MDVVADCMRLTTWMTCFAPSYRWFMTSLGVGSPTMASIGELADSSGTMSLAAECTYQRWHVVFVCPPCKGLLWEQCHFPQLGWGFQSAPIWQTRLHWWKTCHYIEHRLCETKTKCWYYNWRLTRLMPHWHLILAEYCNIPCNYSARCIEKLTVVTVHRGLLHRVLNIWGGFWCI